MYFLLRMIGLSKRTCQSFAIGDDACCALRPEMLNGRGSNSDRSRLAVILPVSFRYGCRSQAAQAPSCYPVIKKILFTSGYSRPVVKTRYLLINMTLLTRFVNGQRLGGNGWGGCLDIDTVSFRER